MSKYNKSLGGVYMAIIADISKLLSKSINQVMDIKLAADNGDADALYNIGLCFYYDITFEPMNGRGFKFQPGGKIINRNGRMEPVFKTNYQEAAEAFQKAAKQGHPGAQFMTGVCYANGCGVDKDMSKAFYWYSMAAENGNDDAQNNLGNMYLNGDFVAENHKKAVELYKKVAA